MDWKFQERQTSMASFPSMSSISGGGSVVGRAGGISWSSSSWVFKVNSEQVMGIEIGRFSTDTLRLGSPSWNLIIGSEKFLQIH